ncbi:hypothetical protein E2C01_069789 [Portunus trituberculatus]|uniref:Uncharacterized protein n=1 Tax=Portunus trituberculatus TaxID=210409 RepID=A0A5B7HVH7_PORTR|nr:hypothetical protein [Portunus trituberculatus]
MNRGSHTKATLHRDADEAPDPFAASQVKRCDGKEMREVRQASEEVGSKERGKERRGMKWRKEEEEEEEERE